ncbi:hypothetical protein [Pelagicoccus albus]|uniref:Uncharacterized protein n=1 Tax=Pelagicoccus albus TaxID=415222 RepID=A0A7X1B8E7_9BACT|nr:hypothetical protein [Pelagicoccus albus]MBC2607585.1 hypothetical protein [Pelagicoccus albus]
MSAYSLLVFGALSLLFSGVLGGLAGVLVGAALLLHGGVELWKRKVLIAERKVAAAKALAVNQCLLAVTVLVYLLWAALQIDSAEIASILQREPIKTILQAAPKDSVELMEQLLPTLLRGCYLIAALVTLFSCLGMAFLYRRSLKR